MAREDRPRQLLGLLIVLVGVVLLVDEAGVVAVDLTGALFGLVLTAIGLYLLVERYRERRLETVFVPALLVLFGGLLVVEDLTTVDAMDYFVPLLVVLVGLAFLTRSWRRAYSRGEA